MTRHDIGVGISVLLADHRYDTRQELACQLQDAGYAIEPVGSGSEAIIQCVNHEPDVLIVDTDLPDIDGFQVCARVRHDLRSNNREPVLVLMADASQEMARRHLKQMVRYVGGDHFIVKPCDGTVLVALLDKLFASAVHQPGYASRFCPTRTAWPTARSRLRSTCPS